MGAFTDLEVWKKSRILRNNITELVKSFPGEEKYRLTDQVIRSSRSIGDNIAEGHGRFHYIDASKFLVNARGSAAETGRRADTGKHPRERHCRPHRW